MQNPGTRRCSLQSGRAMGRDNMPLFIIIHAVPVGVRVTNVIKGFEAFSRILSPNIDSESHTLTPVVLVGCPSMPGLARAPRGHTCADLFSLRHFDRPWKLEGRKLGSRNGQSSTTGICALSFSITSRHPLLVGSRTSGPVRKPREAKKPPGTSDT